MTDINEYQSTYDGTGVAKELQTFQTDVSALVTALNNS